MLTAVKNFITSFLMVTMMAPFLYFGLAPQKTEAFDMGTYVGQYTGAVSACLIAGAIEEVFSFLGTVGSKFMNTDSVPVKETNVELLNHTETTAESTATEIFKECFLDPIVWVAKSMFIDFLTQDLLDWIRTGFDGAEVYLRDSNVYFRKLANLTFSVFVEEMGLEEWLCEPFSITVSDTMKLLAETPHYGDWGDAKCTLEDVFGNLSNMQAGYSSMVEEGDIMFTGGGITVAMSLMTDSNNAYGSLFTAQAEAASRMGNVVASEAQQVAYSDGYFPKRCVDSPESRSICAPGQLIAQQIDDWLGGGLAQLEVADEVSEVIGALIGGLVNNIFFGEDENGVASQGLRDDRGVDPTIGEIKDLSESDMVPLTPPPAIQEPGVSPVPQLPPSFTPPDVSDQTFDNKVTVWWDEENPEYQTLQDGELHQKFTFPLPGPEYGQVLYVVFNNGETMTIPDSTKYFIASSEGRTYLPGGVYSNLTPPTMTVFPDHYTLSFIDPPATSATVYY